MTIREFFETITVEEIGEAVIIATGAYALVSILILAAVWYWFLRD